VKPEAKLSPPPRTTPLDEAFALEPAGPDVWKGRAHPGYAGRGAPFGGVTAAQVLATVLRHPDRVDEPVALTVNFAAAVAEGAFEVLTRPVRTNRATQHWTSEMRQQSAVVLTGTTVTALRRETWSAVEEAMPASPRPEDVPLADSDPVEFLNRYERRFIQGRIPAVWDGSDSGDSLTRLWLRDVPPRPVDFASLTAMCDMFFPRIWRRRATLTPIGTVSLTVYFYAGADQLARTGTGYLLGQARTHGARAGYFDQSAQLWNESGALLATTHQLVYFKGVTALLGIGGLSHRSAQDHARPLSSDSMTWEVIAPRWGNSQDGDPQRKEQAMNDSALERMIDRHLAALCDPDSGRRSDAVRAVWNADGHLVDPPQEGRGHQGVTDQAATVLAHFPAHRFERTTTIDSHHGFLRYGWRLLAPDGRPAVEGVDFAQLDVDGRLLQVVGFFGTQTAA